LLFFFSIFFTNFYTIPQGLTFFLNFENSNQFFPIFFEAKIDEYFLFIINIFCKSIFFFQIPVLCYILINLNLIKKNFFTNNRKFVHIFFLIITAAISPPEIMVQIFLWFWFIFLFEILIFTNLFFKNIKKKK
jgi:sec-independent protein translocase protein TatC